MAYTNQHPASRLPSLILVGTVHAALGYALWVGLSGGFAIMDRVMPLEIVSIDAPKPPPPVPVPQPEPQPRSAVDRPVHAPIPRIDVLPLPPTMPTTTIFDTRPPLAVPGPIDLGPPASGPVPASLPPSRAAAASGDPAGWITAADYPARAQREGREGVSAIRWDINAAGRVENCAVTGSSGHGDLDQAACRAIERRGRYTPALDAAGNAIRSTSSRRVVWRLPAN